MTDTTSSTPTDIQDPLPESSWGWRRAFVFVVTAVILWFLWGAMDKLGSAAMIAPEIGVKALVSLCKWLIGFAAIMATFYLIAPSAELVVKALQVTSLLKSGVQLAGRQLIGADGSSDTSTAAGRPIPPRQPGDQRPPPPASMHPTETDPPWAAKH